jgi:(S)-ureidoglycine aminohydrolase
MHVNIVSFDPGGVIPFAETHVMEHGIYIIEGKASYYVNQDWIEVEAGDYLLLRAFSPQGCIAKGKSKFRYILYKDVNRHMPLTPGGISA